MPNTSQTTEYRILSIDEFGDAGDSWGGFKTKKEAIREAECMVDSAAVVVEKVVETWIDIHDQVSRTDEVVFTSGSADALKEGGWI